MMTLVITVIFGLVFGYFSTQNTTPVAIYFWEYSLTSVPLYLVVLASVLIGLIVPVFLGFIKSFSTSLKINKKEDQINKSREEINELVKKVHKLELENTKMKTELGREETDEDAI